MNKKDLAQYLIDNINSDPEQPKGTFKDLLNYFQLDPYFTNNEDAAMALKEFKNDPKLDNGKCANGTLGALQALKINHIEPYDSIDLTIGNAVAYLRAHNLIKKVCQGKDLKINMQLTDKIWPDKIALELFMDGLGWEKMLNV